MLWDGMIVVLAVVLAVNGWNRGLMRSWRGPIAMILATVVTQHFYIDFSTWIMSRLRINPESGVIIGYLMLWFSLEALLEIALSMLVKGGATKRPIFFDRAGGVVYGLAKAAVVVVLPLMAANVDLKIPPPPADKSGLVIPDFFITGKGSFLIPGFTDLALALQPSIGSFVVSLNAPSFAPNYSTQHMDEGQDENGKPKFSKEDLDKLLK